jgi:hypothetical protein
MEIAHMEEVEDKVDDGTTYNCYNRNRHPSIVLH